MNQILLYGVPTIVGLLTVLQAGLNHRMGDVMGLGNTLVINAFMLLVAAVVYQRMMGVEFSPQRLLWWMAIPGLCGFTIVTGIPWAIPKIGATSVFILVIAAQLIGSLCWDAWVLNRALEWPRIVGAALALVGAYLAR